MTHTRWTILFCLSVALVAAVPASARAQETIDQVWGAYCAHDHQQANRYVCDGINATLLPSQKYVIVREYCLGLTSGDTRPALCDAVPSVRKPLMLQYDHAAQKWDATNEFGVRERIDADTPRGTPTVTLAKAQSLGIVVTHTNPALFASALALKSVDDAAGLADAKVFLATLGSAIGSFVSATSVVLPAPAVAPASTLHTLTVVPKKPIGTLEGAGPPLEPPLLAALRETQPILDGYRTKLKALREAVTAAEAQVAEVQAAAQAAEARRLGSSDGSGRLTLKLFYDPDVVVWHQQWTDVARTFGQVSDSCLPLWPKGEPNESPDEALMGFLTRVRETACTLPIGKPSAWEQVLALDPAQKSVALAALRAARDVLTKANGVASLASGKPPALAAGALRDILHRLRLSGTRTELLPDTLVPSGNALRQEDMRLLHVGNFMFVAEEPLAVQWNKVATYTLQVSRRKSLSDDVTTSLSDSTATFRAQRSGLSAFGFSIGILAATSARVPTWEITGADGEKRVTRVKNSGRAGQLASLVNLNLMEMFAPGVSSPVRPGLEIGATLDTANPALLTGISFEFARVVRLGIGTGWWRIPQLVAQTEDAVVGDNDKLQTKDVLQRTRYYVSATVALGALSLFSK